MSFLGSWLVSEYVYNPNGDFAGINHQQRILHQLEHGRIKVTQICEPDEQLKEHVLGRFKGEWVFELEIDGRVRRYVGPDVLGNGLAWGKGVITGRGFWTRLGFNFTSFGMLANPERQLTGGKFHTAGELKANIVGIAVNEAIAGGQYPVLSANSKPEHISGSWSGTLRTVTADGLMETESALTRRYNANSWEENGQIWSLSSAQDAGIHQIESGAFVGLSKKNGAMLEAELTAGGEQLMEWMEILDSTGENVLGIRKRFTDQVLTSVEFIHLKPD